MNLAIPPMMRSISLPNFGIYWTRALIWKRSLRFAAISFSYVNFKVILFTNYKA
jgi:hypothetical protein